MNRLLVSQIDRIDKIDNKIGIVLAAQIGVFGYLIGNIQSRYDVYGLIVLVIPTVVVASAFSVFKYRDAPDPQKFSGSYRHYPEIMYRNAVDAMVIAFDKNQSRVDGKALRLGYGFWAFLILSLAVLAAEEGQKLIAAGVLK